MGILFRGGEDLFDCACKGDIVRLRQHIRARVLVHRRPNLSTGMSLLDDPCPWTGLAAVHYAAANGRTKALRMLLESGADPCRVSMDGRKSSALMLSCEHGHFATTKFIIELFECATELSAPDASGNSVLHYACKSGDLRIVELFFKKYPTEKLAELVEPGEYCDEIDEYLDTQFAKLPV